jgi:GxxExxY protein
MTQTWNDINGLCDRVRETSFAIHCFLGFGHLEKIFRRALVHRLRKEGLRVEEEHPVNVYDEDGTELGELVPDLFVEQCLMVELKARRAVVRDDVAQLLGYLRASRIENGLLINFGAPRLYVKKYVLTAL